MPTLKSAKVATKRGDDGTTTLKGPRRYFKHHPRIELLGALDELDAFLGEARIVLCTLPESRLLCEVQTTLKGLMAEISDYGNAQGYPLGWLEEHIEHYREITPIAHEFIIPGECQAGTKLNTCRVIARRAERILSAWLAVEEFESAKEARRYLNRLSDFLFTMSVYCNNQSAEVMRQAQLRLLPASQA